MAEPMPQGVPQNPVPPTRPNDKTGAGFVVGLAISLGLFVLLGLIGGVVAYSAVKRKEMDVRKGWNLVPVVVAAQDISENTVVTMEMISQRSVPEQFVTSSVVKPDSASYIINQRVLVPLQAGDMMLWSQFETTKAAERVSEKLHGAARLVTIKALPETAVGGWIRPNDRVDVIVAFTSPDTKEPTVTTLLQNVEVFATGRITGTTNINLVPEPERAYSNVTLSLSHDDAERLALMATTGTLTLALRNETDTTVHKQNKRGVRDVLTR
ncbi:MAG: Flp pilus assembly protein CpaB [Myxococcales bacterium]|nr:Flp pilus assembly protein CpaB [Myxococcales bacterium]